MVIPYNLYGRIGLTGVCVSPFKLKLAPCKIENRLCKNCFIFISVKLQFGASSDIIRAVFHRSADYSLIEDSISKLKNILSKT